MLAVAILCQQRHRDNICRVRGDSSSRARSTCVSGISLHAVTEAPVLRAEIDTSSSSVHNACATLLLLLLSAAEHSGVAKF